MQIDSASGIIDAEPGEQVALAARAVSKSFNGKPANRDVDFVARGGEIHALLGENGAGKTTLISILCGQYRPDAGAVEVGGETCAFGSPRDALRMGVGVVHQDLRQVERFSVVENIVLGTNHRVGPSAEQRIAELSERLGFHLDPRATVATLSVGERQQLEIVKLLFRGMSVLILDEPTAVLAPQQSEQLFLALRTLADEGKAIVFISHRLNEVTAAADVVTVLRQGQVVARRPVAGADAAELARLMVGDDIGESTTVAPGTAGEPVLELAGVSCGSGRRALNEVDLVVRRGEIVGVAGVSGNGQVELAEMAAGMLAPTSGSRVAHDEAIGFIPEDRLATGLVGTMSIAENLAFRRYQRPPMSVPGWLRRRTMRRYAHELIERFRIPSTDERLQVAKLSGGGLQRVIIAREISESPGLLVAAQPTRGLDIVSARSVREQLVAARESGAGVMVVSEDLDELIELSDRIVVMLGGRIVADLTRGEATRTELGRYMTGSSKMEVTA
ncbi:ABC transporter ATP-binding protein [Streptomyces sp. NPDC057611]|uniref:ABC transporter ATP-binding protein n=1 Tax=Streptomyces sp. NPDC057611 TaxID=3346182 RepID=UPI0036938090